MFKSKKIVVIMISLFIFGMVIGICAAKAGL